VKKSGKAGSLDHIWLIFSQKHKMHHSSDLQLAIGGQFTQAGSGQWHRLFHHGTGRVKKYHFRLRNVPNFGIFEEK